MPASAMVDNIKTVGRVDMEFTKLDLGGVGKDRSKTPRGLTSRRAVYYKEVWRVVAAPRPNLTRGNPILSRFQKTKGAQLPHSNGRNLLRLFALDFWTRRPIRLAMLAAILVRLAVMVPPGNRLDDPDNYLPLARSIVRGEGLSRLGKPTAYRPPLYSIVLAPLLGVSGEHWRIPVAALHLALGAGAAGFVGLTARRLGMSKPRVLAAGLIVAMDPVLAWQARHVMTETLAAFLIAAALAALTNRCRWSPLASGALLGLSALCRPSLLPGAGLVAMAGLAAWPGNSRERTWRGAGIALAVAITLTPWAVRNYRTFGEFVWTTTHGGYTLALANNEVYYRDVLNGPPGAVWTGRNQRLWWDSVHRSTAGLTEPEADRRLRDSVLELAKTEPRQFARACLARLGSFWGLAPAAVVYGKGVQALTFLWTAPLWVALAWGLARPPAWRWPLIAAPAMILGLTAVHALYWTDMRMRAPIVPAIALVAASAGWTPHRDEPT